MMQDIRFGVRQLVRRPGFTLAAVLSLALGVGLNVSIFTLVSSLLLEPLPARDPDRLVTIYTSDFSGPAYGVSSYADYQDFRASNDALADLAAYQPSMVTVTDGARSERTFGEMVTPNYFTLLGITPQLGRTFVEPPAGSAAAATADSTPVIVLSHGYWQRRFGGDASVLGTSLSLNGQPFTIIGVAAEGFPGMIRGTSADFWVPTSATTVLNPGSNNLTSRGSRGFMLVGRLVNGLRPVDAQRRFEVIAQRLQDAYRQEWTDRRGTRRRVTVLSEFESRLPAQIQSQVALFLLLLSGLVFLVLLVACANVAGLLLARGIVRQREIAIRLSLGASRGRVVRQLLVEALLLASAACAAGLLIAQWTAGIVESFSPPTTLGPFGPLHLDIAVNWRVLLFAIGLSLATALMFGLIPALQSARPDVVSVLKGHAAGLGRRRVTLRQTLVCFQVGASLVLLIAGGLFVRSLQQTQRLDLGFDPSHIAQATVDLGRREATDGLLRQDEILDRVRQLPGVRAATFSALQPLGLSTSRRAITPSHYTLTPGEDREVAFNVIAPRYFETLRIPVASGRDFNTNDRDTMPAVVIVNEAFAARYWAGRNPLDQTIEMATRQWKAARTLPVVGVVKNAAFGGLDQIDRPMFFIPLAQHYDADAKLFVQTAGDPVQALPVLRRAIAEVDASVMLFDEQTLESVIAVSLIPNRIAATLLGAAGLLGLLLAAVGLFGVLAQFVSERTREIGIRMALGAERTRVLRMIVGQGLRLAVVGAVLGLPLAAVCGRLLGSWLYGVSPADPFTFVVAPLTLAGVALAAAYVPARRAARVNPIEALRQE